MDRKDVRVGCVYKTRNDSSAGKLTYSPGSIVKVTELTNYAAVTDLLVGTRILQTGIGQIGFVCFSELEEL